MFLAQVKLEDVFKSTQQNMDSGVSGEKLLALFLAAISLIVVLAILQHRRKTETTPKPLHHPGKLLKEALRELPLKSAEVKQLKQLADRANCASPLTLLLCPSLLEKREAAGTDQPPRLASSTSQRA